MELLEGESLGGRLRRAGALPIGDAIAFTLQTASALGAAHKKGIVHRDLKPDNLFIVGPPTDESGRITGEAMVERMKVLDFGIAKLQMPQPGDSVKTRTGTLMGTPIYMSPEQCRGTKTVDHRSDVYSLGVIFYEMMVGEPPSCPTASASSSTCTSTCRRPRRARSGTRSASSSTASCSRCSPSTPRTATPTWRRSRARCASRPGRRSRCRARRRTSPTHRRRRRRPPLR
jgi:serine/threonine protein kinase